MTDRTVQELLAKLEHAEWEQRFLAAKRLSGPSGRHEYETLSAHQQVEIRQRLIALLDDQHSQVRKQAADALGVLNCRDAVDALMTALADPNDWVRVQIVEAIGRIGNPFTAQALAQHLESEREPHVRATMVKALGAIGDEKIAPMLAVYLEDKDNRVRANCVEALAQLKIARAELKTSFLKLTNDPSNRVRANIAVALLAIGEDKGNEIIRDMLVSKDEFMRASAVYACGETRSPEERPVLIRLLGDASPMVRKNAVKALVKHGVKAIPELLKSLANADAAVRLGVLQVLAEIRDPSARSAVIPLLEDESGDIRSKAEEVLDILDGF